MKLGDMLQVVNLLDREWDLGKTPSESKGKICAWVYLMEILENSEIIIVEKKDHRVIGVCGYTKWESKNTYLKKHI